VKPDEQVVVGGLMQVRPRMVVQPERVPMPTLGRPTTPEAPAKAAAPTPPPQGRRP
jgi:multidrug efflux system membrane fusion protein